MGESAPLRPEFGFRFNGGLGRDQQARHAAHRNGLGVRIGGLTHGLIYGVGSSVGRGVEGLRSSGPTGTEENSSGAAESFGAGAVQVHETAGARKLRRLIEEGSREGSGVLDKLLARAASERRELKCVAIWDGLGRIWGKWHESQFCIGTPISYTYVLSMDGGMYGELYSMHGKLFLKKGSGESGNIWPLCGRTVTSSKGKFEWCAKKGSTAFGESSDKGLVRVPERNWKFRKRGRHQRTSVLFAIVNNFFVDPG
ncbi:unnamed protein product [Linum trigynum]|uniref:Uncharacterized protein n=1 Tax=Linum trigynum TaxID=586398 RepID=A0AAV2D8Y9_9ROSI